jgi:hypothetical protein
VCILDIDMQGVKALKKSDLDPETLYVFIRPPSMELLEKRLRDVCQVLPPPSVQPFSNPHRPQLVDR